MHSDDATLHSALANLLPAIAEDDWGAVDVGVYDTARLVALAPWLEGHQARIDFLVRTQHADGSWGGPDGYAVVPTLSATGAILAEHARVTDRGRRKRLGRAAVRGTFALHRWLAPHDEPAVPDTIGVELILPALIKEVCQHLASAASDPYLADLPTDVTAGLSLPATFDHRLLSRAKAKLAAHELPQRAWACLEIFGSDAVAASTVRPAMGAVGCSPAATAAWLGGRSGNAEAVQFLETLQRRGGGPVPGVTPITYFEPAWVLNNLAIAGLTPAVPSTLLNRLEQGITSEGVPAAPGLPPDSDDTAAVLAALLRHGRGRSPDCLLEFRTDGYFRCFLDERNPSVSANAHVLETLALYLTHRPDQRSRFGAPAEMATRWLLDQQLTDGSWWDKWHASPYYATYCCVLALLLQDAQGTRAHIDRAVTWLRETQRSDGSWGRWQGTVEETSYAVQTLAKVAPVSNAAAIARGDGFLAASSLDYAPLWHAKDLYTPTRVVWAAQLAAQSLASRMRVPRPRTARVPQTASRPRPQ